MIQMLLLAAVAFLAGFGTAWCLRSALARSEVSEAMQACIDAGPTVKFDRFPPTMILEPEEIVPLVEAPKMYTDNVAGYLRSFKEYFKDRGGRS